MLDDILLAAVYLQKVFCFLTRLQFFDNLFLSVLRLLRFPLFWLSCHNLPMWLYQLLVNRVLKHDGYFVTYFHPWEFYPLGEHPEFKMPFIIRNHSGKGMEERLDMLIRKLKEKGYAFMTYSEFAQIKLAELNKPDEK